MRILFVQTHRIQRLAAAWLIGSSMAALSATAEAVDSSSNVSVDFNREVRPVLSEHCFKCHGPDAETRKAGLRLDIPSDAWEKTDTGLSVIESGSPEKSELIQRILTEDPDDLMPPPSTKNPLTEEDKRILQQWVRQGADYEEHWAYELPDFGTIPTIEESEWPRNPIDNFVLQKMRENGLEPSPQADPYTLIRRLFLDLTGVPPTPDQADQFASNPTDAEYEKWVEHALNSPEYGERWARRWLDLARYADTNGYEKDRPRSIWPYRDWVINAINEDMPFDEFTRLQIAGDMVPNSSQSDRIATGFHRNTMLNEEGGIDPLEFRYYAMVDRVNTTAVTWMGLTLGCAQCHTHKYDPIQHEDYYRIMAYLNNADEPTIAVDLNQEDPKRKQLLTEADKLESEMKANFPVQETLDWYYPSDTQLNSQQGADSRQLGDGSFLLAGKRPEKDTYNWNWKIGQSTILREIQALRIEAMTHEDLPSSGPGRTDHGNFVLTHVDLQIREPGSREWKKIEFESANADFSQHQFPPQNALDPSDSNGWAISGGEGKDWNQPRWIQFKIAEGASLNEGSEIRVTLNQNYGSGHTIGRLRIGLGVALDSEIPIEQRREQILSQKFSEWISEVQAGLVEWEQMVPGEAKSNLPYLKVESDGSVFASGDFTKRDIYEMSFQSSWKGVTAIKIEALPDPRLPENGPGAIYYEGPRGDFFLSEISLISEAGHKLGWQEASNSYASGGNNAKAAIDGDPQTGWSINGGQGKRHEAVFVLKDPIQEENPPQLELLFERYYAPGMGRFKIWVSRSDNDNDNKDEIKPRAMEIPGAVASIMTRSEQEWTPSEREAVLNFYLHIAPELATYRSRIEKLRAEANDLPTTLVFKERPEENPRKTHVRRRGEFLSPGIEVQPGLPDFLERYVQEVPQNRLEFANWLVSPENPLTARVVMNRRWEALFGRGLVKTVEDFGYQGDPPSHPELLDWLAIELMNQGWSMREITRTIVLSSTYRQASNVTSKALELDPENTWLSHAPRFRLSGEILRDSALKYSGLLTEKIGGPSVFPPQPPGVTTEGAYGRLNWNVSKGPDRYRRGLYTFMKRTTPYAMLATFDGPSGESCVAQRPRTNTPLQALTLLNDGVFLEIAAKMGITQALSSEGDACLAEDLFRKILIRPPTSDERTRMTTYLQEQREWLKKHADEVESILNWNEMQKAEMIERLSGSELKINAASWSLLARALMNLDETVMRQ